ncbi:MAG TPA: hypothetical protein VGJ15_13015 [Pirellulales bacterium]
MKRCIAILVLAISVFTAIGLPKAEELSNTPATPKAPSCCPKCGCTECMLPVCHNYFTTKTEIKYRYYCKCETVCIPDGSCWLHCGGQKCDDCGCDGKCNCTIKQETKMVKIPYKVETPVRKCAIEWVCPKCGCDCGCSVQSQAAPTPPPLSLPPVDRQAPPGDRSAAAFLGGPVAFRTDLPPNTYPANLANGPRGN